MMVVHFISVQPEANIKSKNREGTGEREEKCEKEKAKSEARRFERAELNHYYKPTEPT